MQRTSLIPVFFVLLLLLLLAIMSGAVITAGSGIYNKITRDMDYNYQSRVSLSYISEKIRQGDSKDAISVLDINGVRCLVIEDKEWQYFTCIYYSDGYLCESLVEYIEDFDPYMGEQIIKTEDFELDASYGGINVSVTNSGEKNDSLFIALRS